MIYAVCIEKIKNSKGSIVKYKLKSFDGEIVEVEPYILKSAISNKKVEVTNLKLTSSGRLMDKTSGESANTFFESRHEEIDNSDNKGKVNKAELLGIGPIKNSNGVVVDINSKHVIFNDGTNIIGTTIKDLDVKAEFNGMLPLIPEAARAEYMQAEFEREQETMKSVNEYTMFDNYYYNRYDIDELYIAVREAIINNPAIINNLVQETKYLGKKVHLYAHKVRINYRGINDKTISDCHKILLNNKLREQVSYLRGGIPLITDITIDFNKSNLTKDQIYNKTVSILQRGQGRTKQPRKKCARMRFDTSFLSAIRNLQFIYGIWVSLDKSDDRYKDLAKPYIDKLNNDDIQYELCVTASSINQETFELIYNDVYDKIVHEMFG